MRYFMCRLQVKPELKAWKLRRTTVLCRQLSVLWKIVEVVPASVNPNAAECDQTCGRDRHIRPTCSTGDREQRERGAGGDGRPTRWSPTMIWCCESKELIESRAKGSRGSGVDTERSRRAHPSAKAWCPVLDVFPPTQRFTSATDRNSSFLSI